jgi:ABC-2 type transport system ATP-binding protein
MGGLVTTASSGRLAAFEGISKSYGSTRALDGITFSVPEGSVCGLLGPNGSGKTTALRILLGLTRPNEGTSSLLGDTGGSSRREAARRTGALVETPALYERTSARGNMVIEAAARGLGDSSGEIQGLLDLVGLGSRADDRVKGFSLGMRQRLGLATALLGKPKLVILDEPTNGLDPAARQRMLVLIREMKEQHGMNVLLCSHLLPDVEQVCDEVVILKDGQIVHQCDLARERQANQRFVQLHVAGSDAHFGAVLREAGAEGASEAPGVWRIVLPAGLEVEVLWQLTARENLRITKLAYRRDTLEEIFLKAVGHLPASPRPEVAHGRL